MKARITDVWARPLPETITTANQTFVTLRDARNFIVELSEVQMRNEHWWMAAEALAEAIKPDATDDTVMEFTNLFKVGLIWMRLIRTNPQTGKVEPA